jgi:hypothetical protein
MEACEAVPGRLADRSGGSPVRSAARTYAHGVADPPAEASIEMVHGQLSDDRAQQVLDFWACQSALRGAAAQERLREVVCLALSADGEIVGVNSAYPRDVALIGARRFWVYRSRLAPDAESMAPEMINSAFAALEGVVGVSTTYLDWSDRLRMNLWYSRTFVADRHRQTHIAAQLLFAARDHLERLFMEGEDTRAPGIAFELEYEPMTKRLNGAIWLPADFRYIGDNAGGQPVRVHYFPGTRVPTPG